MAEDQIKVSDEVKLTTGTGNPPDKKIYEVVSEHGLFKQGKQYNKGEKIELNDQAAKNFLSIGDIKEVGL